MQEKVMFHFHRGLYADVRIENVFETKIQITLNNLENLNEQKYKAAFIRLFDGNRWYYAATTAVDSIQEEIDNLSLISQGDADISQHPGVKILEINKGDYCKFQNANSIRKIRKTEKLDQIKNYTDLVDGKEHIKMWQLNYLDQNVEKSFYSSKGADLSWDYQRVGFRLFMQFALNDKTFEDSFDSTGVKFTDILPPPDKITDFYDEAVLFLKEAEELEKGKYPVVLSPEATGVFAHESFGHKSETDFMLGDDMMKKEWAIGKKVGADLLSIIDDGNEMGTGFVPFDDEGIKAKKTYLIKKGMLSGRLHNSVTASSLGEELTGNARAVNFEFEPIVRMTTTYIDSGSSSFEDLISGIEKGVYIETLNHGSGMSTFTLAPRRSYLIENGKITKRLKISIVSGSVFQTLNDIDAVSDKNELKSFIIGGCGKFEQHPLPVSFGGPYVRVKSLDVY